MKPTKQIVYLPVKEGILSVSHWDKDNHIQDVESRYGYFFTPEQLNEYTANVIKQALKTAAEKAEIKPYPYNRCGACGRSDMDIIPESITNTFEETFKLFQI